MPDSKTYWVWRDGPGGYWIYDHEYPTYPDGDSKTLGEPCYSGTAEEVGIFIILDSAKPSPADPKASAFQGDSTR